MAPTSSKQKTLRDNARAIRDLSVANKSIRKSMISNASKDFISSLVEAVKNILKGNVGAVATSVATVTTIRTVARAIYGF